MLLAPDTRLNAYRILGPLGKGGMGACREVAVAK